jgi:uncharacterized membrane protein YagU involved in acid resistance
MVVRSRPLLAGALGGALGGLAIKAVVRYCDRSAFGLSSNTDAKAARAVFGEDLRTENAEQVGAVIHYLFGIFTGAAYGLAGGRYPSLTMGRGTVFGGGLWLVGDELAVSAAGLENPRAADAGSHLSALAAHLLYGLIVDALCRSSVNRGCRSERAEGYSGRPRTR